MKKPDFIKKYRTACLDLLGEHAAALHVNMGAAVKTQREIMDDKSVSPQIRLNAANEILRIGLAITDRVNILDKIKELEGDPE